MLVKYLNSRKTEASLSENVLARVFIGCQDVETIYSDPDFLSGDLSLQRPSLRSGQLSGRELDGRNGLICQMTHHPLPGAERRHSKRCRKAQKG